MIYPARFCLAPEWHSLSVACASAYFLKLTRRQPCAALERSAEMALVGKPDRQGCLGRRHTGIRKQMTGIFDAQFAHIVPDGTPLMLAKAAHEVRRMHADGSGYGLHRDRFVEMRV